MIKLTRSTTLTRNDMIETYSSKIRGVKDLGNGGDPADLDKQQDAAGVEQDSEQGTEVVPTTVSPGRGLTVTDPLQRYLADIRRFERISAQEEQELLIRYLEDHDTAAARRLITGNLRLVVKIALRYRNNIINLLDLVQEGNIGLLHALKKFDPTKRARFSTYATWWVKAYVLRFILNNWSQVRFATSNTRRKVFFNLNKEKRRLEDQGFTVGTKLLAQTMNVSDQDIREIEPMISGGDISLDEKVSADSDQTRLDRLVSREPLPEQTVVEDQFQELLREKLEIFSETLKPREKILLEKRLLAEEPAKLRELGEEFGVTREAVRLMEKKIVKLLRTYIEEEMRDIRSFEFSASRSNA